MVVRTDSGIGPRPEPEGGAPAQPPDDTPAEGGGQERERYLTRGVWKTGLVTGAILLIAVYAGQGSAPQLGARGAVGAIAAFLVLAAVFALAGVALAYILRWYWRDIGAAIGALVRAVARVAGDVASWALKHGSRHGERLWRRLQAWADRHKAAREAGGQDQGGEADGPQDGPQEPEQPPQAAPPPERAPAPAPAAGADAPAGPATNGVPMTTQTTPPRQARGTRVGKLTPGWRAVVGESDDSTPDVDLDIHDHLHDTAAGLHDKAQAMQDFHDRCVLPGVRVGKEGMAATAAAADAIAACAEAVLAASKSLEQYYQTVSGEVASGLVLPESGDFITGQAGT